MSGIYELVPTTIAAAFAFGMILALLGSIKLPLAERLGIDESRVGGLLGALNLSLIPMVLLSGVLIDAIGVRWVLLSGSLVAGLALFGLAGSRSYRGALTGLMLAGGGGACLSTGASVLMPEAFGGPSAAAATNLGNVFFGLGALVTPALADVLIRGFGFRRALSLLAVVALLPALAAGLGPASAFHLVRDHPTEVGQAVIQPVVWLTGLVFVLYCPLEGALGTWATTYLTGLGDSPRRAARMLSAFWLAFLGSRLLAFILQYQGVLPHWTDPWVILILALLAAVVLGNLAGAHRRTTAGFGLIVVGALLGPIFPTLVGALFDAVEPAGWGTAFGVMYAIGSVGGILFPPVIGAYARRHSVRMAFRIPTLMALALAGAALVLLLLGPVLR